jgi:hypothetical protein
MPQKEIKKGCKYLIFLQPFEIIVEAASGFEPENNGFADRCLTTWLCRRKNRISPQSTERAQRIILPKGQKKN